MIFVDLENSIREINYFIFHSKESHFLLNKIKNYKQFTEQAKGLN